MYLLRTMIVPSDMAPLARALAEGMEPVAGAGMWQTGLSPSGKEPATHFVSAGMIEDTFAPLLSDAAALFAAAGGSVTMAQCQALVSHSDVSEESPFDAFARLGLRLAQE